MSAAPRRRTRAEQQAETRARLVEAAAEVFAAHGFEGASIDLITQRAGYTRGAFYSNFSDKGELLAELSAARMRDFAQLLPDLLTAHRDDQVAATARWLVDQGPLPEVLLLVELARQRREDPRIAELVDDLTDRTLTFVADVLAASTEATSSTVTSDDASQALLAAVLGVQLLRHLGTEVDQPAVELLIGGVLEHATDGPAREARP